MMKRLCCILLAIVMTLLSGCGNINGSNENASGKEDGTKEHEALMQTEIAEEYSIPKNSLIYTNEVMPDTWVFTDGLGRQALTNQDVGDLKEDKSVGMFYWDWHEVGQLSREISNIQETVDEFPLSVNDYANEAWVQGSINYWNEPIYGYYTTTDTWVLRKQGELLANLGVDVVFLDYTNGYAEYRNSRESLFKTWSEMQNSGVDTPKISFQLPFVGAEKYIPNKLEILYMDIYQRGHYQNVWFYWEDKPLLVGDVSGLDKEDKIESEILEFFDFRLGVTPRTLQSSEDEDVEINTWPWLDYYPQHAFYKDEEAKKNGDVEIVAASVAQNADYNTKETVAMNGENVMGRSYSSDYRARYAREGKEASKWGYNFSEQMDYAIELDPDIIYITGWNEWTVGRYESWGDTRNAFVDEFDDEFSRDIEPTKGELKDHYYYLTVNKIREYKGAREIPQASTINTIDLNGGQEQWSKVAPYYASYVGNTGDRNSVAVGENGVYLETSGRNDIIGAQVARDEEYIYFNVECSENITSYQDKLWMNLYIDCNSENAGWESFDYVINKSPASATTSVLEKFTGNGYESDKVADVSYTVDGRYMTVKVAKKDLGLSGNDFTIDFLWTDNVHDEIDDGIMTYNEKVSAKKQAEKTGTQAVTETTPLTTDKLVYDKFSGDIMDFYISGDVAPGGRFKYRYESTEANALGIVEEETVATEEESNSALWIIIGVSSVLLVSCVVTVVILSKKKKKNVSC